MHGYGAGAEGQDPRGQLPTLTLRSQDSRVATTEPLQPAWMLLEVYVQEKQGNLSQFANCWQVNCSVSLCFFCENDSFHLSVGLEILFKEMLLLKLSLLMLFTVITCCGVRWHVCFVLLVHTGRLCFPVNLLPWWCDTWIQILRLVGYVLNDEKVAEDTWNELGT